MENLIVKVILSDVIKCTLILIGLYRWTETSMWNQGALVKHFKELFKAEGISNAAEPGHSGHSKFYVSVKIY